MLEKIVVNINSGFSALSLYEAGIYDYIYLSDVYKEMYKDSKELTFIDRNGQAVLKRNYVRDVKYNGFPTSLETVTHFNTLELKWAYIQGKE